MPHFVPYEEKNNFRVIKYRKQESKKIFLMSVEDLEGGIEMLKAKLYVHSN